MLHFLGRYQETSRWYTKQGTRITFENDVTTWNDPDKCPYGMCEGEKPWNADLWVDPTSRFLRIKSDMKCTKCRAWTKESSTPLMSGHPMFLWTTILSWLVTGRKILQVSSFGFRSWKFAQVLARTDSGQAFLETWVSLSGKKSTVRMRSRSGNLKPSFGFQVSPLP